MAAHADDLRHWYAEHIGPSLVISVGAAAVASPQLSPGRYLLHTRSVSGAAALWINQGSFGDVLAAVAAAPSTPLDLAEAPRPKLMFMVRARGKGRGAEGKATDGLSFITNAGSVDVVITRISLPP